MKKKKSLFIAICLFILFAVWTVLVRFIDVRAIGPQGSIVGFSTLNGFIHDVLGVNMSLYIITDWLGLVPIATALSFAVLGLVQWIKRKNLFKVDRNILVLGVFYIIVIAVYLFFEMVVVNYRPVLIDGYLEASYPSSTTMLVLCVMPTAVIQLQERIKNSVFRRCIIILVLAFTIFMVVGRLLAGVHWITDIIGGSILSVGLVTMYYAFVKHE